MLIHHCDGRIKKELAYVLLRSCPWVQQLPVTFGLTQLATSDPMKEAANCGGLFGQAASKGRGPNSLPSRALQIGIETVPIRSATEGIRTYLSNSYFDMGQGQGPAISDTKHLRVAAIK